MSNARAARRRAEKDRQFLPQGQNIVLKNPVADHFASFIAGNAVHWERLAHAQLTLDAPDALADLSVQADTTDTTALTATFRQLVTARCTTDFMVHKDSAKGQHLILCGAGPSLADHAAEWCSQGDQVWGCNSAATWLHAQGHKVTHGFTVDQTAHMVEEWSSTPPIEYLIATTCHPHLAELLTARGRTLRFFHNYVGVPGPVVAHGGESMCYEDWLYCALFPPCIRSGAGLNSVNRAIDVAQFMGFERITVLGADCALRVRRPCPPDATPGSAAHRRWLEEETVMHADGGHAMAAGASMMTLDGEIDGRVWTSKPDMLVSAVWLVQVAREHPGITFIGDTLVNALIDKPDSYLRRLPTMVGPDGKALGYPE